MWTILRLIPLRTMAWVLLAAALVLGLNYGYNSIYDAGYDQARQELEAANALAIQNAVEKARTEWRRSAQVATEQLKQEGKLLEKIHEIERRITLAVNSVGPDCRLLGNDVLGLFNSAVDAANSAGPADTSEPPERVR